MTKRNTFRHNRPASVASLRRLFAFSGTPFGFSLESPFTFTGIPTFQIMHARTFDALVIDCAEDTLDILSFTAKAQGLQPSIAVFLTDEWGDELAIGLEELTHVLTMLQYDECARLAVESRTA